MMLSYFPTPYPDELWYSVICRYHVRNGSTNMLTSRSRMTERMFGAEHDIQETVDMLPYGLFSAKDIILNHTMFPYLTRMYPYEEKVDFLNGLCSGTTKNGMTVPFRKSPILKYCPVCSREETERYGESYWHREHQTPLSTVCRKHKCRLAACTGDSALRPFLPWMTEEEPPDFSIQSSEVSLAKMVYEYFTIPIQYGPTAGYSNLAFTLESFGYLTAKRSGNTAVDAKRLYEDLVLFCGSDKVPFFFGKKILQNLPAQLRGWSFQTAERYILLAAFLGQSPEVTFGESLRGKETKTMTMRQIHFSRIAGRNPLSVPDKKSDRWKTAVV